MPESKPKRKQDKQRPYRIDYFIHDEMLKDRALVRSIVIRDVTADDAEQKLAQHLGFDRTFTVIRSYRFYKKLTAEPKKKVYKAVDELLSAKKAIEVMTEIENRKAPIVIRPEDLQKEERVAKVMDAIAAVDPTTLPPDHPEHVCSDECYDIVEVAPKDVKLPAEYFDTSDCSAGRPAPMPTAPTGTCEATAAAIKLLSTLNACKWHGEKYVDQDTGRCTALDSGSEYLKTLYSANFYPTKALPKETEVRTAFGGPVEHYAAAEAAALSFPDKPVVPTQPAVFDDNDLAAKLDELAPIIHPPAKTESPFEVGSEFPAEEVVQEVLTGHKKGALFAAGAAIIAILGCVYVYLHYFAR